MHQVLLFYKYVKLENPEAEKELQVSLCEQFNLKSRIIIAPEGINGTLEGLKEDTEKYIAEMRKHPKFFDVYFKKSEGNGHAFPKINVKVRKEILSISLKDEDFDPNEISGKYMTPDELEALYENGAEFYVVDMRNDFEHKVGFFDNSVKMPIKSMRELPENMDLLEDLKDKKVITVCTGGVKCEKASGYLVKKGFKDVYQLHGGVHAYIEKYPNKHFKGKLYVYDGRVVMGFDLDSKDHVVVAQCDKCGKTSDNYVDCDYIHCKGNRHFVCCKDCIDTDGKAFCSNECRELYFSKLNVQA